MKNLLIYTYVVFQLFIGCTNQKNSLSTTSQLGRRDLLYIKDDEILQFQNFSDIKFPLEENEYQYRRVNIDRDLQDSLLSMNCNYFSLKIPMLHFLNKNSNYCYIGNVEITGQVSSQLYSVDDTKSKKILLINSINDKITSAVLVFDLTDSQPKGIHSLNEGLHTVLLKNNILMTIIEVREIGSHNIKNIVFTIFEIDTNGYTKIVDPKLDESIFPKNYFDIQEGW